MKLKICLASYCFLMLTLTSHPASALLIQYTDRSTWLAAAGFVFTEDFESDSSTTTQTPFTTANGYTLDGINNQFTMQIIPIGAFTHLANGTQFLHFSDFTAGLLIKFPASTSAFGFDYGTASWETGWTLSAANSASFTFPQGAAGFIGYVEVSGSMFPSFILTGPSGAQGGLSIDNISIAAVPEPSTFFLICAGLTALLVSAQLRKICLWGHSKWGVWGA